MIIPQCKRTENYKGYFSEAGDRLYLNGYIYQQFNDVSFQKLREYCQKGFLCFTVYVPQRNRQINLEAHNEFLRQLRRYNVRHINMADVWRNKRKPELGSVVTQYAVIPLYPWRLPLESLRIFCDLTNVFDFPDYLVSTRPNANKFKGDIWEVTRCTSVESAPRIELYLSSPNTFFTSLRVSPDEQLPRQWEFLFGGHRIPSEDPKDLHVVQNEYEIMISDTVIGQG